MVGYPPQGSGGAGSVPSDTVVNETTNGQLPAAGGAATASRGDHTHGTPPVPALDDLSDVTIAAPVVDQILKYNGADWVNGAAVVTGTGTGVIFYLDSTKIIPSGVGPQTKSMETLLRSPSVAVEVDESTIVNNNTVLIDQYMHNTALGVLSIDAGEWDFDTYTYVSDASGVSEVIVSAHRVFVGTGTIEITGVGTTRTATVTGGTPFVAGDFNADISQTGKILTPNAVLVISGFTSTSVVTVTCLATYTNEAGVAYSVGRYMFQSTTGNIDELVVTLKSSLTVQPAFVANLTDKLMIGYYAKTTNVGNITVHLVHNGATNYTHFHTPLIAKHNDLAGLQGGVADQYYHLTSAEYTGTGTNHFVRETGPTIVTPTIASFINANHTHAAAGATGGVVNHTTLSNIGTNTHAQLDTKVDTTLPGLVTTHAGLTTAHGSTPLANVNTIMQRDAAGRSAVVAPAVATDIALKSTVTDDIATHAAVTATHGATGAIVGTTNNQLLTNKTLTTPTIGDFTNANHTHAAAGATGGVVNHTTLSNIGTNTHAQIDTAIGTTLPGLVTTHAGLTTGTHGVGVSTIASVLDVTTHAGLTTGIHGVGISAVASVANIATHAALTNTHGATASATADRIVLRDAAGRSSVIAPALSTDIAIKSTVTDDIATHAALTTGVHGLGTMSQQNSNNVSITGGSITTTDVTATDLKSATTTIAIDAAAEPIAGQVLTAINGTSANWQTVAAGMVSDANRNTKGGTDALRDNLIGTDNTAIGYNTLMLTTGAGFNTGFGSLALDAVTTGVNNTAFGYQAGSAVATTNDTTCIGYQAGLLSTGASNTFVGSLAGDACTSGGYNTALGYNALGANTISSDCTMIGYQAGLLSTGASNTFVGSLAGDACTSGGYNTAVGKSSLTSVTFAPYNAAFGVDAGRNCIGGYNTFLGASSGENASTGTYNVAVGQGALQNLGAGNYNVVVGASAAVANTANDNVFIGHQCGDANTTGTRNVAVGKDALGANITGADNTTIGYQAGLLNTANNNTFVGSFAGSAVTTGTNITALGNSALLLMSTNSGATAVGTNAGLVNTAADNTFVGYNTGDANTTGTRNVAVGKDALGANITGNDCTCIGYNAGLTATGAGGTFVGSGAGATIGGGARNTALGYNAMNANTGWADNIAVGYNALGTTANPVRCTAIGSGAMTNAGSSNDCISIGVNTGLGQTANYNVLIGNYAGDAITTGWYNTAIGHSALSAITTNGDCTAIGYNAGLVNTAANNTFVGSSCGDANTSGTRNVAVGKDALGANTTASDCTMVGYQAGLLSTGINNTFVGSSAGSSNTTGAGNCGFGFNSLFLNSTANYNTCVGWGAGYSLTTGDNTCLGKFAGSVITTGANNTLIGSGANGNAAARTGIIGIGKDVSVVADNTWVIGTIGIKQAIVEGANAAMGVATLVAGTIVVANTLVTANSRIFLTSNDPNGGTQGAVFVSARTVGTDFTITSTVGAADVSIVAYEIKEPN